MKIVIMDGRARFNVDRAVIVSCCDSLKEAKQEMRRDYKGYDYVVVDLNNEKILYDPLIKRKMAH